MLEHVEGVHKECPLRVKRRTCVTIQVPVPYAFENVIWNQ